MSDQKKELIKNGIIIVTLVTAIITFIKPVLVKQTSMLPTLQENNYLILSRQSYTLGEPKHGDIVVFPKPNGNGELYIKRVIGLPGDEIEFRNKKVFINGKAEKDTYTKDGCTNDPIVDKDGNKTTKITVPKGELFLMGDNRNRSLDSREIGTIPIKNIIGKVKVRLWPFNEIQLF